MVLDENTAALAGEGGGIPASSFSDHVEIAAVIGGDGTMLHALSRLGNGLDRGIAEIDGEQGVGPGKMDMGIDETWRDRPAAKVNHLRGAADASLDLIRRADSRDLPAGDGHRLGDRVSTIDRKDRSVDQHQIRGVLRGRTSLAYAERQPEQRGDQAAATNEGQTARHERAGYRNRPLASSPPLFCPEGSGWNHCGHGMLTGTAVAIR